MSASEAGDAPEPAPDCAVGRGDVTVRELRRDDLERVVALYLDVMHDQFLASTGAAFLRRYFRVWLESPSAIALVASGSDGTIAGMLLGALVPAGHYRWMIRRGGGQMAMRLVIHGLRHPSWGVRLVRTRGTRYARGVIRMIVWTQRRRTLGAEVSSGFRIGEVTHLVVAAQWRRRGIGRALLSQAQERAVAAGIQRLTVATPVGWASADFYARLGWINCGERVTRSDEHFIRFEFPLSDQLSG